jgi:hypothetical protein
MPTTITLRLQFAPDGRLRESETLGSVTERGATRTVSVEDTVIATDEWLDSVPDTSFVFTPPAGNMLIDAARAFARSGPPGPTVKTSLTQAARAVLFTVWSWPGAEGLPSFRIARIPPDRLDPPAQETSYEQLLLRGVAVELTYATREGKLVMTEGPAGPLRRALQQLPPPWRSSEHRTLTINGTPHDGWVMHGTEPSLQWAGVELNGSLFLLEHNGPEAELEAILAGLGALQKVER